MGFSLKKIQKKLWILFTFFIAQFIAGCNSKTEFNFHTDSNDTSINDSSDIVGGVAIKNNIKYSHSVVMIYFIGDNNLPQICTGSFISENVILTAAHCTTTEILDMNIIMSTNPFSDTQTTRLTISETIVHPDYNPSAIQDRNDLALIRINEKTMFPSEVLTLPTSKNYLLTNKFKKSISKSLNKAFNNFNIKSSFTSLGYGLTTGVENETNTPILRKATYESEIKNTKEINILQNKGKGVCFGDSGGPLLIHETSGREILIGVASGVYFDAHDKTQSDICKSGSVFINITYYLDWIDSFLNIDK